MKKQIFQYTAVFESDKKRGGYVVSIPALPGCFSEGDTFEKAFYNIKEAAQLYLEVMKEKKEELPEEQGSIVAPVYVGV